MTQGQRVAARYPQQAEEITWRVEYLANKWEQLEAAVTPTGARTVEVEIGEARAAVL